MKTKVVHVIGGLKVGGAEVALLTLVEHFKDSEVDCCVFSLGVEGGMRERFERAKVRLHCFDFKHQPIRSAWSLVQALRRERPDVVQTWLYHADLIGGVLGRLAGCRAILWGIHSIGLAKDAKFSTRVVRRVCAGLSWVVPQLILCVASASKTAHALIGYEARRMVVFHNGYDFSRMVATEGARARLRKAWQVEPGCRLVGTIGRFCDEKDYPNFIRATARIAMEEPDVRFLLVGRGLDSGNQALMQVLDQSGHRDRYILAGERSDVMDCLSAMDLFCLSSRMEAFPNVLIEAMASGLPCVSTEVGDVAKIVADWGVLVPKEDDARLADGIRRMIALPDAARESLGAGARAHVTSEFSIQKSCEAMRAIYERMLGKGH